jgi:hypothetical protein
LKLELMFHLFFVFVLQRIVNTSSTTAQPRNLAKRKNADQNLERLLVVSTTDSSFQRTLH